RGPHSASARQLPPPTPPPQPSWRRREQSQWPAQWMALQHSTAAQTPPLPCVKKSVSFIFSFRGLLHHPLYSAGHGQHNLKQKEFSSGRRAVMHSDLIAEFKKT